MGEAPVQEASPNGLESDRNSEELARMARGGFAATRSGLPFEERLVFCLGNWENGADCKSAGLRLHWFESSPAHFLSLK